MWDIQLGRTAQPPHNALEYGHRLHTWNAHATTRAPKVGINSQNQTSLADDRLDLGIQRLALSCLATHWAEAFDVELLARCLASVAPLLQRTLCEVLLGPIRSLLAHDLAAFALRQRCLCQTARGLHLAAPEDQGLGEFALSDHALLHCFLLHCFHCPC